MIMEESKSIRVRGALRAAEAAVLFSGAFVELLLLIIDKEILPVFAILISACMASLCFFSWRSAKYFLSKLDKVTSHDLIFVFVKLSILVAVILFVDPLREFLADLVWMTSALIITFILQLAGLCVGYFTGRSSK
jgi:hypothetical protein